MNADMVDFARLPALHRGVVIACTILAALDKSPASDKDAHALQLAGIRVLSMCEKIHN